MDCVRLPRSSPHYPDEARRYLAGRAPATITALGNLDLLRAARPALALFCSIRCPGSLTLRTYDLARHLRDARVTVIGGFHSPMERECLALLLRGTQPVIVCPARGLEGMRLPTAWREPLAAGRLLLLSPFDEQQRRATADLARTRNELVAAIADQIFVAHAEPGGKTEAFAREMLAWGKPLLTFDDPENHTLIRHGAQPATPDRWTIKT